MYLFGTLLINFLMNRSSTITPLVFPDLIHLSAFGGNFTQYFSALFDVFEKEYIKTHPYYDGKRVVTKRYPEEETMHRTFYHLTHSGDDEKNREPNLERMSMILYPKFCIENSSHEEFIVWENERGKDERVLILHLETKYLTVITKRKDYYILTTAYLLDKPHAIRKCLKEYKAYIKAKTA